MFSKIVLLWHVMQLFDHVNENCDRKIAENLCFRFGTVCASRSQQQEDVNEDHRYIQEPVANRCSRLSAGYFYPVTAQAIFPPGKCAQAVYRGVSLRCLFDLIAAAKPTLNDAKCVSQIVVLLAPFYKKRRGKRTTWSCDWSPQNVNGRYNIPQHPLPNHHQVTVSKGGTEIIRPGDIIVY